MGIKFDAFIKFDKNNIKERLRKLPSAIYYFGQQELELEKEVVRLETELGLVKAKLASHYRVHYKNKKQKVTETTIKDNVHSNPEVEELVTELDKKKDLLKVSKLRMKTLYALSDSMTQYGHYVRLEKNLKRNNNS
jgi:hypothetical protein